MMEGDGEEPMTLKLLERVLNLTMNLETRDDLGVDFIVRVEQLVIEC